VRALRKCIFCLGIPRKYESIQVGLFVRAGGRYVTTQELWICKDCLKKEDPIITLDIRDAVGNEANEGLIIYIDDTGNLVQDRVKHKLLLPIVLCHLWEVGRVYPHRTVFVMEKKDEEKKMMEGR